MANGVNSSFQIDCGSGFYLRVRYHETYDVTNNISNVYVDGVDCYAGISYYDFYPDGKIYIDGTCVKTLDSRVPTGSVSTMSGQWVTISSTSGSKTSIAHNADGSKSINIALKGNRYEKFYMFRNGSYGGWGTSTTKSVALTTIPRASTPTCVTSGSNTQNVGDIGSEITIYTNRASSSFTHTLKYSFGSTSGTIATSVGASTKWTIPMSLCNQIPSAVSGTGTITCETYNGSTKIGTKTCSFTCSVPSTVVPTISDLVAALDNSANGVIAGWNLAVAGYTKVKLTASAAGSYGSTISSFTITGGYSTTVTGTSLNYTGAKITSSGTKTFTIYATDSRGRKSSTLATSVIFYAYSNPTISNFMVSRNAQKGTDIDVTYAKSFSSVNGKNAVTGTLKYKKHSDSSWTTYGIVASGTHTLSDNPNTTAIEFEEAASYDFQLSLTDTVGNSATATAFMSTLAVLMDFRAGGKGLGIGKIAETDNMEVALDTIFMGDIFIQDSAGNKKSLAEYIKSVVAS